MGRPRDWTITALDPFDVTGVRTWTVRLEQAKLEWITRSRLDARVYRLKLVMEVLQAPTVVFQGWERPEHEDDLCYVGSPARDFPKEGIDVPAPKGFVFLVYVTKSGVLSDWRWEKCDPENPNFPENWNQRRYGRLLWPPNSI
jgi:hypothetical protein